MGYARFGLPLMKIKICGITNKEDALDAIELGASALGFIFYEKSPRCVEKEVLEELSFFLPPFVQLVGVFVNHSKEEIEDVVSRCHLDLVQLHGDESPEFCSSISHRVIKSISVSDESDIDRISAYQGHVSAILLDTKVDGFVGGTGQSFDWGLAIKAMEFGTPIILAGGITIDNLQKAIQLVNPYAVDISSGVESSPGKKDYNKMRDVISVVRNK